MLVLSLAGSADAALAELDDYLTDEAPWSAEGLVPHPFLDPIREHPRFGEVIARHRRRDVAASEG